MRYDAIDPTSRFDAEIAFASGDRDRIIDALIGVAMGHRDWPWVQEKCIEFVTHPDPWVRRACGTALLHIARLHRQLDMHQAMQVFNALAKDPETAEEVPLTLEEIHSYLGNAEQTAKP